MKARHELPSLIGSLDEIGRDIRSARSWTLFLDFDGTLAPIVPHPDGVCVPEPTLEALGELARLPQGRVAIVSGRSIADLRRRLGVPCLCLAGNHGLEIDCPGSPPFVEPGAAAVAPMIREVAVSLRDDLAAVPGALVESKGLTATVHFRMSDTSEHDLVSKIVLARIHPHRDALIIRPGKMVLEIRPRVEWGKGHAILWLVKHLGREHAASIFLGDDATDEDGFLALGPTAITARVGPFDFSMARYNALDVEEVSRFLRWLRRQRPGLPNEPIREAADRWPQSS